MNTIDLQLPTPESSSPDDILQHIHTLFLLNVDPRVAAFTLLAIYRNGLEFKIE